MEWQQKAREDRNTQHEKGERLMEKAAEMLNWPLAQVEYASGVEVVSSPGERAQIMAELIHLKVGQQTIELIEQMPIMIVRRTTFKPSRWTMRDAALLAEAGAKLQNFATGQPTSHEQQDLTMDGDKRPSSNEDPAHKLFPIASITVELAQPPAKITDEDEDEEQPRIH